MIVDLNKKKRFFVNCMVSCLRCAVKNCLTYQDSQAVTVVKWRGVESTLPGCREQQHQQIEIVTLAGKVPAVQGPPSVPMHRCHEVVVLPIELMTALVLA